MSAKFIVLLFLISLFVFCDGANVQKRTKRRINIPFLGIGRTCSGCPPHFCDDDPAIVYGYCCGCATFYDYLPVVCPPSLSCPINNYDICHDYEYMMHCCCHT